MRLLSGLQRLVEFFSIKPKPVKNITILQKCVCNFCSEACHAHGHKTRSISDVCDKIRELGLQKKSDIEKHASSINEESNGGLSRIERIDDVSYNCLNRQQLEKNVLTLHDRKFLFLFYG